MNEDTKTGIAIGVLLPVVVLVVVLILAVPLSAYTAFVGLNLYNWFLIPLHFPHLTFWHFWGLCFILAWAKSPQKIDKTRTWKDSLLNLIAEFIALTLALAFAAVIKGQM